MARDREREDSAPAACILILEVTSRFGGPGSLVHLLCLVSFCRQDDSMNVYRKETLREPKTAISEELAVGSQPR